ncbi:hypothetical protein [Micromonospora sp. A202]|uniref:hypothetical protein n=1 Tax=Micromonospora sp. A202 TaxID=2572899 RepID=UPI00115292DF|nr:hypothetical protein [Micromonospora sp. A202]
MAKQLSMSRVFDIAVGVGVIPESATVDRRGRATWSSDEFALVATLERLSDGRIGWHFFVGDLKFGPALSSFGGLSVAIDPAVDDAVDWPTVDDSVEYAEEFLHGGIGAAQGFVVDRLDLARLIASESDVLRGNLTTWLPLSNYPARLVQALILARDLGSTELEAEIEKKLRSGTLLLPGGREVDIASSAKRWAKQYAKALGREVPV